MKLYNITNKTSSLHIGYYPGRTADEALDAFYSDAGYSCRVGAARALEMTVEALLADLIVAEYDYADDLATLAAAMVEDDRTSGECTVDVLDDPNAGSSDHWDDRGVYGVAALAGLSRATVDAIGWDNIRDAYAAAWRAAVERDLAAVEAAIMLVSDVTSASHQEDGSYVVAIADDGGADAERDLARLATALPRGWRVEWTGNGDTDADGYSTSDARVWRDEVAS